MRRCAECEHMLLTFKWYTEKKSKKEYEVGRIVATCLKHPMDDKEKPQSEPFELPDLNGEDIWISWETRTNSVRLDSGDVLREFKAYCISSFNFSEVPKAWMEKANEFVDSHDSIIPIDSEGAKECDYYAERVMEEWNSRKE